MIKYIKSESDNNKDQTIMIMSVEDMIGRNFLGQPGDDGERHRVTIVKAISNYHKKQESNPELIKFLSSFNDDQYEEIYAYKDIIIHIEKDNSDPDIWKFKHITTYEGSLERNHPNYKGCPYNIMIEWETGEISREPLIIIAADDPVICAIYTNNKNLLETKG